MISTLDLFRFTNLLNPDEIKLGIFESPHKIPPTGIPAIPTNEAPIPIIIEGAMAAAETSLMEAAPIARNTPAPPKVKALAAATAMPNKIQAAIFWLRVQIVEDNLINLKLAKVSLELEKYEVRTATSVKEALGGEAGVKSELKIGSHFYVILPCKLG